MQNIADKGFIRTLGDGLVLRHAVAADTEALADFNGRMHIAPGTPERDEGIVLWTRDLMCDTHPTFRTGDNLVVEDTRTGAIVSTTNLISQVWAYAGIPFKLGRPELVATDPGYRNRGLVRALFEEIHRLSAERGEPVQAITGIPYYYRQFGYEMTLSLSSKRLGYKAHIPALKEGEQEPFEVRPAASDDLAFIAKLYDEAMRRYLVTTVRDAAMWRYELDGRSEGSVVDRKLCIIETPNGERVGFLAHAGILWGTALEVNMLELARGTRWGAVMPSVLRYIGKTGARYAERGSKAEFGAFILSLGDSHPAYDVIASRLPRKPGVYTYFMRVPDPGAFIMHVAPAIEERLARSAMAGHTGSLKLHFYRGTLGLAFDNGRLIAAAPYAPTHQEDGDAFFPNLTFLHLLFGHLEMADLERVYPDCYSPSDETKYLLKILFPKEPSMAIAIS